MCTGKHKTKSKRSTEVYTLEQVMVARFEHILKQEDLSQEELAEAYAELLEQYKKLLSNSKKITTIGDKHQRKVLEQKNELAETLEKLRRTQTKLIESEKMASLGGLVAGVAHEINTPIGIGVTLSSSIIDRTKEFAHMYEEGKMSRQDLEDYLEAVYESSELLFHNMRRIGDLVQSFKQVSVDQSTERKRPFLLKTYIEDVLRSLSPKLKGKSVHIETDIPEDIQIESYPGIFAQIVTNLVLNSLVHGFAQVEKGTIALEAKREENRVALYYRDDGKGMPQEVLSRIFEPFFTTDKQIGTGLGMHIIYNLVTQKLQGEINCQSGEGKGIFIAIQLPLRTP